MQSVGGFAWENDLGNHGIDHRVDGRVDHWNFRIDGEVEITPRSLASHRRNDNIDDAPTSNAFLIGFAWNRRAPKVQVHTLPTHTYLRREAWKLAFQRISNKIQIKYPATIYNGWSLCFGIDQDGE